MSKNKNYKIFIEVAIHVLIWVVLFYIPVALSSGTAIGIKEIALIYWLQLFFMAIIFYSNYLWIVERFLFNRRNWFLFIAINFCLFVLLYWIKHEIFTSLIQQPDDGRKGPPVTFIWYSDFLIYLIPIAFAIAIKSGRRLTNLEVFRTEAENAKLQADLQTLKFQLQPHFFFNALNNIYSLIETEPDKARSSIHSLSKLMRHLLQASEMATISLKEEMDFLNKYIALMQVRLTSSTSVVTDFPASIPDLKIAPLLFISLVENAFKHGVSVNHTSEIYFGLQITNDRQVIFTSRNKNFSKPKEDLSGSGIGLDNLRKRLALLYPGRHQLTTQSENGLFEAVLEINLNNITP
ncbi:MAG: histidine kinase [Bacteroidetes bacterium]|nr:histidine kinase [Bacteroidota bacterium]